MLFTKLDECGKWGMVYDIKMLTDRPLSYITVGQNVAEDISVADCKMIANKIMGCEMT